MSDDRPLLSEHWYRVAALRPRLDPQIRVERISYRQQVWHVLVGARGARSMRLSPAAYAYIGRCTGANTAQRVWDAVLVEFKDDAPTQDEVLGLFAQLRNAGMLNFERRVDLGPSSVHAVARAPKAAANSLLAFRLPLGAPDAWLARLHPRLAWLFQWHWLAVWAVVVGVGFIAAVVSADVLVAQTRNWMASPHYLLLAWLAYPLIKAVHEIAHGLCVKHWGGTVPQWGITLLVFTPVPFVDASSASAFPRASQRFAVSMAGIVVELFLASLALLLGLSVQPGLVQDLAFIVFFVGAVSTLAVNGNPLMRFDGYHALTDALELPNLDTRSRRHWLEWLRKHVLRVPTQMPIVSAPGEARWLWAYAPLAWSYRLLISVAIIGWLASLSFLMGAAMALYFLWTLALKPLLALLRFVTGHRLDEAQRTRARRRLGVWGAAVAAALLVVPLPFVTLAQGVVWLSDRAQVRAGTEGFVVEVHVKNGEFVREGDLLVSLESPRLVIDHARAQAMITSLQAERFAALRGDPATAAAVDEQLRAAEAEFDRLSERLADLQLVARADGVVAMAHEADLPGRFVRQGDLLAHLITAEAAQVRVALPQEEVTLLRKHPGSVSVRLAEDPARAWKAEWARDFGAATVHLPSAALGTRSGGDIAVDPVDTKGVKALHGVVIADLALPFDARERAGGRAWVRFDLGWEPLAWQAARRAQQLFLRHFHAAR